MKVDTRPDDGPETVEQAREWTKRHNKYLAAGLCFKCAPQAAYGHQLGFSRSHPPCPGCESIVADFPVVRTNGWRSIRGRRGSLLTQGPGMKTLLAEPLPQTPIRGGSDD